MSINVKTIVFFILLPFFTGCDGFLNSEDDDYPPPDFIYVEYYYPVISPDGESIAFFWSKIQYIDSGYHFTDYDSSGIWIADLTNRTRRMLYHIDGILPVKMEYSPDGEYLHFSTLRIRIADGMLEQLPIDGGGGDIALSNDGEWLVFKRDIYLFGSERPVIHYANVDGTVLRTITVNDSHLMGTDPDWFPDCSRIVFSNAERSIVSIDTSGENYTILFDEDIPCTVSPTVSPNGELIAFVFDSYIYRMNADGSDLLCISPRYGLYPVWSADGEKLIYISGAEDPEYQNQNSIWMMNPDGTDARQVVP